MTIEDKLQLLLKERAYIKLKFELPLERYEVYQRDYVSNGMRQVEIYVLEIQEEKK